MATPIRLLEQNLVLISGNLTRDPESLVTKTGNMKCWFTIASNRRYKDKTGEWKDMVSYVPVYLWGDAAERCKEKLRKGSPVHIEGRLASRKFEDKNTGQNRTVLEIEARRVQVLEKSGTGASSQGTAAEAPAAAGSSADLEEVPF